MDNKKELFDKASSYIDLLKNEKNKVDNLLCESLTKRDRDVFLAYSTKLRHAINDIEDLEHFRYMIEARLKINKEIEGVECKLEYDTEKGYKFYLSKEGE